MVVVESLGVLFFFSSYNKKNEQISLKEKISCAKIAPLCHPQPHHPRAVRWVVPVVILPVPSVSSTKEGVVVQSLSASQPH